MARYPNLPLQSNSSFQQRILNEIISAVNTIELDPLPTDAEFLHQAQGVLFAGTFLPGSTTNTILWNVNSDNSGRTSWIMGGGNAGSTTVAPTITLQGNTFSAWNGQFTQFTIGQNLSATQLNLSGNLQIPPSGTTGTFTIGGSPVITQATLPPIPPAVANSFALVTLTGNITGTIGLIFNGNVLTMNVNIQVGTLSNPLNSQTLIAATFSNTTWQNFINRLNAGEMQGPTTIMEQWIAGTNNTMDDVRAILRLNVNGLSILGVNSTPNGSLNTGDRWNVMVSWAITI